MPTVPMAEGRQVSPTPQPGVQLAAPDMPPVAARQGQMMGDAAMGVGRALMDIARQQQDLHDEAAIKELDNTLADQMRSALHDPNSGYLTRIGKSAVEGRAETVKNLQDTVQGMGDGLQSDVQKAMWHNIARQRLNVALTQVDAHAAQQTKVWAEGETVARLKSSVADATATSQAWALRTPDGKPAGPYNTAKATAVAEARSLAELRGYDSAATSQLVAETLANLHTNVLSNMVSLGQSQTARAYLEAAAPEIAQGAPDRLDNLRNLVKQAGVKDESLALVRSLGGKGLTQQLKALDDMQASGKITAEVYDATRQRAEHNWQLRKAQQAEGEKALLGNAYDWVLKNPSASIMDMPPAMYNGLKNTGHLASLVGFARTAGKPETDPATYYGLRRMAMDEPAAFAGLNLLSARNKLSPQDWEQLVGLQASVNKSDAKAMESQRVLKSVMDMVEADAKAIGINFRAKSGSEDAKKLSEFQTEILRAIDQSTAVKGAPLTSDEGRRIGLNMVRQYVDQGAWIGGKKYGYQISADMAADPTKPKVYVAASFGDIPAHIRDALTTEYRNATNDNRTRLDDNARASIERAYTKGITTGRF